MSRPSAGVPMEDPRTASKNDCREDIVGKGESEKRGNRKHGFENRRCGGGDGLSRDEEVAKYSNGDK